MFESLATLLLLGPVSLIGVAGAARFSPNPRPRTLMAASQLAALFSVLLAAVAIGIVVLFGSVASPTFGIAGYGISVRADPISTALYALVSIVGFIVLRFSRSYLDGDPRQGAFFRDLCLTLACVSLLVLSNNLAQLVGAWVATSWCLHRLLLFYRERPGAVRAARKKFIVARIGDGALFGAAVLMVAAFDTADIGRIAELAASGGSAVAGSLEIQAAALLLAVAAMLKSAQFPTHGWLVDVMETPTPVSALLHAGIINAGGFLLIRFGEVLVMSEVALGLLAAVGTFTALFGAFAMSTQTSVKVSLAYSTVGQMGFMLLQCGLGAFPVALVHLVAHSLYKAHAFLASGSAVDYARGSRLTTNVRASGRGLRRPQPIVVGLSLVVAVAVSIGMAWGIGYDPMQTPAPIALGIIFAFGAAQLVLSAFTLPRRTGVRVGLAVVVLSSVYYGLHSAASAALNDVAPAYPIPGPTTYALLAAMVVAFGMALMVQLFALRLQAEGWYRAAYVHMRNGLYANALFNRMVEPRR